MGKWKRNARMAVRDTIARYTWCGDFGDVEGFVACFTEDAVLEIKNGPVFAGHDGVRRLARGEGSPATDGDGGAGSASPLHHHVSSVRIEIEDRELARAWAYFLVLGPVGIDHWGRYADELVPVGNRWLFRRRRVSVDGAAPGSLAGRRYLEQE